MHALALCACTWQWCVCWVWLTACHILLITFLLYKRSMGFRSDPLPARVGYARLIDLYYMTTIQSCFQCFCRVPQVHPTSNTNLKLPVFMRVFKRVITDLSNLWKEWMAGCVYHRCSAGIFQVTCSGRVGDTCTSCLVIGPFVTN